MAHESPIPPFKVIPSGESIPMLLNPSKSLTASQKQHRRILRNRELAKMTRSRNRAKQEYLEARIQALTQEVNTLQEIRDKVGPAAIETDCGEENLIITQKLKSMLGDSSVSEGEINEVLGLCKEKVGVDGVTRNESLKRAFHRTVDMIIPEEIRLAFLLCQETDSVELKDYLRMTFNDKEMRAIQVCKQRIIEEKVTLQQAYQDYTRMAETTCDHAEVISKVIEGLRPLVRPSQCAYLNIWMHRHYIKDVSADRVLNYGHNTAEVLNFD